jgi:hypothetical protein
LPGLHHDRKWNFTACRCRAPLEQLGPCPTLSRELALVPLPALGLDVGIGPRRADKVIK